MAEMTVSARHRTDFGKGPSKKMRRQGMVPGIVYGGFADNIPVAVNPKDLFRLLRSQAGRNTILNLDIEGTRSDSVILKDWQIDPVDESILHADFQRIAMDRTLRVMVPVVIRGTAYGVKAEGGVLEVVTKELEVECLPFDIPNEIECDVTDLALNRSIRVGELSLIDNVEVLADREQVVVHIVAMKEEVVEEAEDEDVGAVAEALDGESPEPEVAAKGKVDEGDGK